MERISNYQLFAMTVLFQLGTTIIFGFASTSGRDAWIAALVSGIFGVVEVILFTTLMRLQPGLTLVEWFPAQLGRWLGTPIAWMYPLLFIYGSARIITDLKDLIQTTILQGTPPLVYLVLFMIVVSYVVYAGIEVLGRLGEFWLPVILLFFITETILLLSSGITHFEYLQPVLYKGWEPVWNSVWPLGVTQSTGETLLFAMVWASTKHPERIMKTTVLALVLSMICIALLDILAIIVLGEVNFQRSVMPLYILLQQISVFGFIENLDAIGIMYFIITSFFKMSFYMFATVRGIQQLTLIRNNRVLIVPVALCILFIGMTMASSLQEHLEVGLKIYPWNLWLPMLLVLPTILLIVIWIRKTFVKRNKGLKQEDG